MHLRHRVRLRKCWTRCLEGELLLSSLFRRYSHIAGHQDNFKIQQRIRIHRGATRSSSQHHRRPSLSAKTIATLISTIKPAILLHERVQSRTPHLPPAPPLPQQMQPPSPRRSMFEFTSAFDHLSSTAPVKKSPSRRKLPQSPVGMKIPETGPTIPLTPSVNRSKTFWKILHAVSHRHHRPSHRRMSHI